MPDAEIESRMHLYGDEDGERWFACGHWTVDDMIGAAMKFEAEVADPVGRDIFDRKSLSQYWVIEDPDNDERYKVVEAGHEDAEPMTMIARA